MYGNTVSVIDIELHHGVVSADDPANSCFWFDRDIERLASYASDQKARDYMDITPTNNGPDPELSSNLTFLRDSQLSQLVSMFLASTLLAIIGKQV